MVPSFAIMNLALHNLVTECYRYREVLESIVLRDLKLRYKGTALGYLWSLLNPLLQLLVLSTVFSHVVRLGMRDYTLYLFSGLLAWAFVFNSLISSAGTFLENENFIKKIYLPKAIFPLSKVCLRSIDFIFGMVALGLVGLVAGYSPHATFLLVPVAMALLFTFTLGISLMVAVMAVYFRDVQYILNVLLQALYFATPILYPISALPESYRPYMELNPLYSQVRIFQAIIYDGRLPSTQEWLVALGFSFGMLLLGLVTMKAADEELVFRL